MWPTKTAYTEYITVAISLSYSHFYCKYFNQLFDIPSEFSSTINSPESQLSFEIIYEQLYWPNNDKKEITRQRIYDKFISNMKCLCFLP